MTSYIFLLAATFALAFVMGMLQFFLRDHLSASNPGSRDYIMQSVSAFVTAGTVAVYFLAGPLVAAVRKRHAMLAGAVLAAVVFCLGGLMHWRPNPWLYLLVLGALLGIFNAAKMASAPLLATQLRKTVTSLNAGLSVVLLLGVLGGFPAGSWLYSHFKHQGFSLPVAILVLAGLLGLGCRYPDEAPRPFRRELGCIFRDTIHLFHAHWLFLVAGPLLWGVASAAQLAAIELAIRHGAKPGLATLIPLWAALGSIVGTVVSPWFHRVHHEASVVCALAMCLGLPFFPVIGVSYTALAVSFVVLGIFFGVAVNLIDSSYLERVGSEGKEGQGAALQSAMIALSMVIASGTVALAVSRKWVGPDTQFVVLAAFSLLTVILALVISFRHGRLVGACLDLFCRFVNMLLWFRYRIEVVGLDRIPADKGVLILPNHPAEIDPVILEAVLWRKLKPRPVVVEDFFEVPALRVLFNFLRAMPMPNIELGRSAFKTRRVERAIDDIEHGLRAGDNVLIYPSGMLQRAARPLVGGASAVHSILQRVPEAQVLLVRTQGLWGSSFSWAARNGRPSLGGAFLHGALVLLANALLFTPRRKVVIEIQPAPVEFPRAADRTTCNQWLDKWYNANGDSPLALTRYYFWSPAVPKVAGGQTHGVVDVGDVPATIRRGVCEELARMRKCSPDDIEPKTDLRADLGFDSLEMAEVFFWLDARFGVSDVRIEEITTAGALMLMAQGRAHGAADVPDAATPRAWQVRESRPAPMLLQGDSVLHAFLASCDRMGKAIACADDRAGVVTYRRLKFTAILLARVIARMPGDRIGIMLPASVGGTVCFFASLLAGKVPVMINWTVGRRNLDHVVRLSGIKAILTSRAFVDNADTLVLDDIEDKLVFLEQVKRQIGLRAKLAALYEARMVAATLISRRGLKQLAPADPAVILFTSGSESVPKGVPLSNRNLLADIDAVAHEIPFKADDTIMAFLPPFHSFGLMATTLTPVLCGFRVAFYPNPTEARRIAHAAHKWHATLMAGTPTFLSAIIKAARPGQLDSLRLLVTGAEKAPEELFARVGQINSCATLIEGYGITECSPIVSLCRPGEKQVGVGRPLPGVTVMIVDPDTHKPVEQGGRGLILVSGPTVFAGYLGNVPSPFLDIDNARWYNTGDLGYLAPDGSLVIAGRLKRFVKIGGEMISLPAIEEALNQKWPRGDDAPNMAVAAVEITGGRPIMAIFTTLDITADEANEAVRAGGFSPIVRIASVHKCEAIPVLGTGKTDYRTLNEKLRETAAIAD